MNFTPKTEEQLDKEGLLPKGKYPFEVLTAEDTRSKRTGADMIAMEIRVFGDGGAENKVKDWLVSSYLRKLFNFAKVTGLSGRYHAGNLCAADCRGRQGWVLLEVEEGGPKNLANPDGEKYPSKNVVKDYIFEPTDGASTPRPAAQTPAPAKPAKPAENLDEDVPF